MSPEDQSRTFGLQHWLKKGSTRQALPRLGPRRAWKPSSKNRVPSVRYLRYLKGESVTSAYVGHFSLSAS